MGWLSVRAVVQENEKAGWAWEQESSSELRVCRDPHPAALSTVEEDERRDEPESPGLGAAGGGSLHLSPEVGAGPRALILSLASQVPIILGEGVSPLLCSCLKF